MTVSTAETLPRTEDLRSNDTWEPDDFSTLLERKSPECGGAWAPPNGGAATTEGVSRKPPSPIRPKALDGGGVVAKRFRRHAGDVDVVCQELAAKKGIEVSFAHSDRSGVGSGQLRAIFAIWVLSVRGIQNPHQGLGASSRRTLTADACRACLGRPHP